MTCSFIADSSSTHLALLNLIKRMHIVIVTFIRQSTWLSNIKWFTSDDKSAFCLIDTSFPKIWKTTLILVGA